MCRIFAVDCKDDECIIWSIGYSKQNMFYAHFYTFISAPAKPQT